MKHIDKVFKDKLYNQKATVPDGMWDKIAPALEEKSGRAALWFWFAGILTLLIGGLGYMIYSGYQSSNINSTPLAAEINAQDDNNANSSAQISLLDENNATHLANTPLPETEIKKNNSEIQLSSEDPAAQRIKPSAKAVTKIQTQSSHVIKRVSDIDDSNTTLAFEETINTDNLYGKPANLVITKSYLSDNGSIIKQSNLAAGEKDSEPSYNVFINSEGLNAGALLRIVEPLENIPLPAFNYSLKKKITL